MSEREAWGLAVVIAGAIATLLWRVFGVALSGRTKPDSPLLDLIGCIAYAMLAALVARMILLPIGPLQATGLRDRLLSAAAALVVFYVFRRNLLAGVLTGGCALALLAGGFAVFG